MKRKEDIGKLLQKKAGGCRKETEFGLMGTDFRFAGQKRTEKKKVPVFLAWWGRLRNCITPTFMESMEQ